MYKCIYNNISKGRLHCKSVSSLIRRVPILQQLARALEIIKYQSIDCQSMTNCKEHWPEHMIQIKCLNIIFVVVLVKQGQKPIVTS